jgi:hypothetical protein
LCVGEIKASELVGIYLTNIHPTDFCYCPNTVKDRAG